MLFRNYVDDKMNEMSRNQKKQQQQQKEQAKRREGEVSINYKPGRVTPETKMTRGICGLC